MHIIPTETGGVKPGKEAKASATTPAVSAPAKKAVASTTAATATDKPPAAPTPPLSVEGEILKQSIEACGDAIRAKKTAKATKEEIKALVDQLMALKTSFTESTGLVFGPPMVPVGSVSAAAKGKEGKKESKKDTKKETAVVAPEVGLPPAIPIHPPASVVAATPRRTRISLPIPSSVWKQEVIDITRLEEQLRTHSYVTGAQPTAEDVRVLSTLANSETDVEALKAWCATTPFATQPQVSRWLRSMASFTAEEIVSLK